jgi:trehalose/maltose transport system substrate-binding protein
MELELCRRAAETWSRLNQMPVKVVTAPQSSGDRLGYYQLLLASESEDIDVFVIDTTWSGVLGDFFLNLDEYFPSSEPSNYFTSFSRNNRVNGRWVALPWFIDAGVLYYRRDLLQKHGFKVPVTWEELTQTAQKIQDAERKQGHGQLWGYVFQGRAYEGLTCNALEWIHNAGGGAFVDERGKVTVNNPDAQRMLDLAQSWVGKISPPGVLNYTEEESRAVFQSGDAIFMRNWPYAWKLSQTDGSPVQNKVGISRLPFSGENRLQSGTLGGWSLAVSKFSRDPKAAVSLIRYLTRPDEQKRRAHLGGLSPTWVALYQDPEVLGVSPALQIFFPIFETAVPRPSRIMGAGYSRASSEIWDEAHQVLSGSKTSQEALADLEKTLNRISHQGDW